MYVMNKASHHLGRLIFLSMVIAVGNLVLPTELFAADIPKPEITKGKGESCIADKDFMRRNHMDLLQHDRDKTVHEGDRKIKYSLKKCISCHAIKDDTGTVLTAASPKHFCRSCHDYAAVSIDCFQCHASRPQIKVTDKIKKDPHQ